MQSAEGRVARERPLPSDPYDIPVPGLHNFPLDPALAEGGEKILHGELEILHDLGQVDPISGLPGAQSSI